MNEWIEGGPMVDGYEGPTLRCGDRLIASKYEPPYFTFQEFRDFGRGWEATGTRGGTMSLAGRDDWHRVLRIIEK